MDAQYSGEERSLQLSIAYHVEDEGRLVCSTVDKIVAKYPIKPETYTCNISDAKEVLIIEYHDDLDREAGVIFEEIMKELNIIGCD